MLNKGKVFEVPQALINQALEIGAEAVALYGLYLRREAEGLPWFCDRVVALWETGMTEAELELAEAMLLDFGLIAGCSAKGD